VQNIVVQKRLTLSKIIVHEVQVNVRVVYKCSHEKKAYISKIVVQNNSSMKKMVARFKKHS
jgi:hypothetical protein